MAKLNVRKLAKHDTKRNIGEEMLRGVHEMKAGVKPWHRVHRIEVPAALEARIRSGLSQHQAQKKRAGQRSSR